MRRVRWIVVVTLVALALATAPAVAQAVGAPATADVAAAVRAACTARARPAPCRLESQASADLGGGVTEHTYVVRVGPQKYDRIALHRIVTNRSAAHAVFMVPGDSWGFDAAFAGQVGGATRAPNVATSLARKGVDVWGLDMRWVLVPADVKPADTSFMQSWGMATMLADIGLGTTVERVVRQSEGAADGRTALLGWSRGAELAYSYAAQETQLDPDERNVTSLVPVDMAPVYDPTDTADNTAVCRDARQERRALQDQSAVALGFIAKWGTAALRAPDRTSHDYPDYTNREVGLFTGGVSTSITPWFHYLGETVDSQGTPTAARYSPETRYFGFMTQIAPYESLALRADGDTATCDGTGSRFFRHMSDVTVPLFYLGAAGGFGTTGDYMTTLVGSTDVSSLIVRALPVGSEVDDFGHVDLWLATTAAQKVWNPLATWIEHH